MGHRNLVIELRQRAAAALRVAQVLADEALTVEFGSRLIPPRGDFCIVGSRITDSPVHLRRDKVDSAFRKPRQRVGADAVILPVAARAWLEAIIVGMLSSHTCRADAEAHPRLCRLDCRIELAHHIVDILTTPVQLRHCAASGSVFSIVGSVIACRKTVLIEIVVKHHAVDIIFADQVDCHVDDSLLHLRESRIEDGPCSSVILPLYQPVRMAVLIVFVAAGITPARAVGRVDVAVRVHPCIHLDTTFVGILNKICHRVERRSLTACAGNVA